MGLFACGVVLFALLMASYSHRGAWLALGSATLSITLVLGLVFLALGRVPSPVRQGLAQLGQELPAEWNQHAETITAAVERASTALASAKKRAEQRKPILAAATPDWLAPEQETGSTPEPAPAPAPLRAHSGGPIKWFFDQPSLASNATLLLSGANVSDHSLEDVKAVLKPDLGGGTLVLALAVEGRDGNDAATIPPGARFSLAPKTLTKNELKQLGGAILSFSYTQDGARKTSITYLTPPMLGGQAARE